MSWSKQSRLFIGQRVTTLEEEQQVQDMGLAWNEENEKEYLNRVRRRAQEQANEILSEARTQAENIKAEAYQQGLQEGERKSQKQISKQKQELQTKFNSLFDSLQEEKQKLWSRYEQDILELLDLALEKAVTCTLEQEKKQILSNLLVESLQLLDNQQEILIRVHPKDNAMLEELLKEAQAQFPSLAEWRMETSKSLKPGDLILENRESRIDNSVSKRWSAVRQVLEQLALNGGE